MKITTLNLQHGGSARAPALAEWLAATESDVVVCSEFRPGRSGDELSRRLALAGYTHQLAASEVAGLNTVGLFSRLPAEPVQLALPPDEQPRLVAARIGPLTVAGAYFAQLKAKRPLFEYLLSRPQELGAPAVVIGDFNTGLHYVDEVGATFHCADEFQRLSEAGWVDAWRLRHGAEWAFSWQSNAGNGFRIDHAFVTADLAERVISAAYDHSPRGTLTDHAALTVELRMDDGL